MDDGLPYLPLRPGETSVPTPPPRWRPNPSSGGGLPGLPVPAEPDPHVIPQPVSDDAVSRMRAAQQQRGRPNPARRQPTRRERVLTASVIAIATVLAFTVFAAAR